ncbi:MAG TPA: hypothetical protein VLK65_30135 [Vicinamibacteria bacterium]|nr:hypothetical protein [Vicinamibacteria bacterium]
MASLGSRASTRDFVLENGKILILLLFCLVNPFAGWAYLAQSRHASTHKPPSIVDTLKPTRLAVLPLASGDQLLAEWTEAIVVDFAAWPDIDVVPVASNERSRGLERDVLALGNRVHADFVLDANLSLVDDELRLSARLVRLADGTVRWAELYVGAFHDLPKLREAVCHSVLSALSSAVFTRPATR